jgi:hypothetical protein
MPLFKAHIARAGVYRLGAANMPELANDGSLTAFHMSPDVLRRAASRFDGLPVTIDHLDKITIDDVIGVNKGSWFDRDGLLKCYLDMWCPKAIKGIKDGSRRQVSFGFDSHYRTPQPYGHDCHAMARGQKDEADAIGQL